MVNPLRSAWRFLASFAAWVFAAIVFSVGWIATTILAIVVPTCCLFATDLLARTFYVASTSTTGPCATYSNAPLDPHALGSPLVPTLVATHPCAFKTSALLFGIQNIVGQASLDIAVFIFALIVLRLLTGGLTVGRNLMDAASDDAANGEMTRYYHDKLYRRYDAADTTEYAEAPATVLEAYEVAMGRRQEQAKGE